MAKKSELKTVIYFLNALLEKTGDVLVRKYRECDDVYAELVKWKRIARNDGSPAVISDELAKATLEAE